MSRADGYAMIQYAQTVPRYVKIKGRGYTDENDDLIRLQYVEALERLEDEGYIEATNPSGTIFRLNAKGTTRARKFAQSVSIGK